MLALLLWQFATGLANVVFDWPLLAAVGHTAGAAGLVIVLTGAVFVLAGVVGLLRFPDTLSRLHALTKADNVDLGLIVIGLLLARAGRLQASASLMAWGMTAVITYFGAVTGGPVTPSTLSRSLGDSLAYSSR